MTDASSVHSDTPVRWMRFVVIAAILVAGAVVGAMLWGYLSVRESTDDAQVDGHINPVSAVIPGTVVAVEVRENDEVAAGDVLVRLDRRPYEIAVEKAEADLAEAEAGAQAARASVELTSTTTRNRVGSGEAGVIAAQGALRAAEADVRAVEARRDLARARVREAEANATKTARDRDRLAPLAAKNEIPRQQYEAAEAAADAAAATLDSSRAAVDEAESQIGTSQARLAEAQARVEQAQADLQAVQTVPEQLAVTESNVRTAEARIRQARAVLSQAMLDLEHTLITAPVAGVISRKTVEVGQVIQSGQPLLAVVPLEDVWITANFKETQLERMAPGQRVEVSVDAYGGLALAGRVESISSATGARFSLLPPENATGNYVKVVQRVPVRIVLDSEQDPDRRLRPGMSVVVTVMVQ